MNNDALMRRIAAATEAQKAREPITPTEPLVAQQPVQQRVEPTAAPAPEGPSHLAAILSKGHNEIDPGPAPVVTQPVVAEQPSALEQVLAEQASVPVQSSPVQSNVGQPAAEEHSNVTPLVAEQSIAQPATPATILPDATSSTAALMSFKPSAEVRPETASQIQDETVLTLGVLVSCDGINATVRTTPDVGDEQAIREVAVGQMIAMAVGASRVIGLVYHIEQGIPTAGEPDFLRIQVELQGEIRRSEQGARFHKGIANYPGIGTQASRILAGDLAAIYAATGDRNVVVGHLAQDESIPAYIDVEAMLSKHFAVLGSTGCGKSSAVSLLLRASQEVVTDLRTVILDPHNEYSSAFPEANILHAASLDVPFWLFQLEEYAEVLFRGKPIVTDEVDALREFIPDAKQRYRDGEERTSLRSDSVSGALTADTPVPYRISDVLAVIDEELGLLEARFSRTTLKSLRARITAHVADPRYGFMFRDKTISDKAEQTLNRFFNLESAGSLMTILQMSGMPSEVVNAIASVLCRLSFELCVAAKGKLKILVVCEEAHRYVPADQNSAFEPTRRAIARIAKEGRKYGSFISIISQRPAELDPTILSQCSTVFSLRMSNEHDQSLIRKAISNSSKSTISFLSSLANREAIAFGEGLSTPMRLRFSGLPAEWLPGQDTNVFDPSNIALVSSEGNKVFRDWRGVTGASSTIRQAAVGG